MRYISDDVVSFSIRINERKASARVTFLPVSTGGSSFSTDSDLLIAAMEGSSMFNKIYRRAPECVNEVLTSKKKAKTAPKPKKKVVVEVNTWQDAVEYLVENFGLNQGALVTPDEILGEAEAHNIDFPNLR